MVAFTSHRVVSVVVVFIVKIKFIQPVIEFKSIDYWKTKELVQIGNIGSPFYSEKAVGVLWSILLKKIWMNFQSNNDTRPPGILSIIPPVLFLLSWLHGLQAVKSVPWHGFNDITEGNLNSSQKSTCRE